MAMQLYNNSAVHFICARNFLWDGVNYEIGQDFDQDIAPGRLDLLVRTRRLVAVVDDPADKPRHWHHHVWLKDMILEKLGVETSSAYNKPLQRGEITQPNQPVEAELFDPAEHNGPEVIDYLESDISTEERERVLAAEQDGKNRKTVIAHG